MDVDYNMEGNLRRFNARYFCVNCSCVALSCNHLYLIRARGNSDGYVRRLVVGCKL